MLRRIFPWAKLLSSAETKLKIELVGGDKVIKEPGKFLLQDDSGTGGEQAWLISRSESRIKPPPVARLKLEGSELYFEWVPIVTPAQANSLRNCGLLITAGEAEHFVQLRAPKSADPLKLNLDLKDRGVRVSLQLENPPPASRLRLKLLDLNDPFPASNFEPGNPSGRKTRSTSSLRKKNTRFFRSAPYSSMFRKQTSSWKPARF